MELHTLSPSLPLHRRRIERFLQASGLRYDDVDYYAVLVDEATGEIVAGGGLKRDVIKCVAVADAYKGEAMANSIVSHLISHANAGGYHCVRLYTKPQNRRLFESLSFRLLAEAPEAILMETGIGGIGRYVEELRGKDEESTCGKNVSTGCIVMNANPFTLGHRYLVERSSELVERLYVVVVREDCSMFSYNERKAMVSQGVGNLGNVVVVDGSDYAVSAMTFPTYFLKRTTDATDTQILLDLDIYRRHIAPALGATVRFVGSEPSDPLTRRYNELMRQSLGENHVREIPRMAKDGIYISASCVRQAISGNCLYKAIDLVPPTTIPYIIAHLATRALQTELATTPKPGLVDRDDNGAHSDMDFELMSSSIQALHPYFVKLAQLGFGTQHPAYEDMARIGQEAERAMFNATDGVNTYKGALFALGLAVVAVGNMYYGHAAQHVACSRQTERGVEPGYIRQAIVALASQFPDTCGTHGSKAREKCRLTGALDNARGGYRLLFDKWLPFYERCIVQGDRCALHRTLLRIMCDLDDTNIVYRTSVDTMRRVKAEARLLLEKYPEQSLLADSPQGRADEAALKDDLKSMNTDFIRRNVSPGGSADMLSLVVFLSAVVRKR